METGGLVIQHHIISAGHAHKVVASCGGEQQKKIVGGVLVGGSMIGITDVAAHGQTQQFSHEVIFQSGANDLALVVEILRPDESHHAVDEKRFECACHAIGT